MYTGNKGTDSRGKDKEQLKPWNKHHKDLLRTVYAHITVLNSNYTPNGSESLTAITPLTPGND